MSMLKSAAPITGSTHRSDYLLQRQRQRLLRPATLADAGRKFHLRAGPEQHRRHQFQPAQLRRHGECHDHARQTLGTRPGLQLRRYPAEHFLCFNDTFVPPGTTTCFGDSTLKQVYGIYQTHTQYGNFALTLTPIDRMTIRLGYSIVDNQGTRRNSIRSSRLGRCPPPTRRPWPPWTSWCTRTSPSRRAGITTSTAKMTL